MGITELARMVGASVDQLRYMEKKGFLTFSRKRRKQRVVREYQEKDIRKINLILKYRRQEFTWDAAFKKAAQDLNNPRLFEDM